VAHVVVVASSNEEGEKIAAVMKLMRQVTRLRHLRQSSSIGDCHEHRSIAEKQGDEECGGR
jgi:hypothetical protein